LQLCKDERIKHIKQLERSQNEIKCDKLYKGQNDSAIPDSYIIIAKDERESTASVSVSIMSLNTSLPHMVSLLRVYNTSPTQF